MGLFSSSMPRSQFLSLLHKRVSAVKWKAPPMEKRVRSWKWTMHQCRPRVDAVQAISANQGEQRGQLAGAVKEHLWPGEKDWNQGNQHTLQRKCSLQGKEMGCRNAGAQTSKQESHGDLQPSRDPITEQPEGLLQLSWWTKFSHNFKSLPSGGLPWWLRQ